MNDDQHHLGRWAKGSAIVGGAAWLGSQLVLPVGWGVLGTIARLLLLAILVLTPLALALTAPDEAAGPVLLVYRAATYAQPFAAAFATASFWLQAGVGAALLAAIWLVFTGLIALYGLARFLARRTMRAPEICIEAGLLLAPVGGIWLVLSRLGADPLGFGEAIVLLTAVHFHYAGFAVPILTGRAGRLLAAGSRSTQRLFRLVTGGVILGVPLVALGITFSRMLEVGAVVLLTTSLLILAVQTLVLVVPRIRPRPAQGLLAISAASSIATMLLAIGYAAGALIGLRITLPQMVLAHGALNAFGFTLCGLLAWTIAITKGDSS